MHRINIKLKSKKFKVNPKWEISSRDGWTIYNINGVGDLKVITKPEWRYMLVYYGEIEPFELHTDKPNGKYYTPKNNKFAPSVRVSGVDEDGYYHILTEAGYFKIRFV